MIPGGLELALVVGVLAVLFVAPKVLPDLARGVGGAPARAKQAYRETMEAEPEGEP